MDGVVLIQNKVHNDQTNKDGTAIGTGFFIDDNVIVTNNHVVDNSIDLKVKPRNSQLFYDAEVVGTDPVADIAVIRLKNLDAFKNNVSYKVLGFAQDTRGLEIGQKVFTLGNPWGLDFSASQGIISALSRRPVPTPKFLIQTDAHVFQGNSGGPMLNEAGEVIGVNSMMLAREGGSFGLAAPAELVQKAVRNILAKKESKWPYLGLILEPSDNGQWMKVKEVAQDGSVSAKGADIQVGDEIVAIVSPRTLGSPVRAKSFDTVLNEMAILDEGDQVTMLTKRNGEDKRVTFNLIGRPSQYFVDLEKKLEQEDGPTPIPPAPGKPAPAPKKK